MPVNVKLPKNKEADSKKKNRDEKIIKYITFFGDSAIPEEDEIYKSVWSASKLLAENDYTIVNGGGPGIMKAATDGAESVDGETFAIYWEPKLASFFEGKNLANTTDRSEADSNYVIRTLGLIEHGDVYVVCKGGTGTISEFGLVWCLAKLYYGSHKPVILYGDFWPDIIKAMQKGMYIDEKELGVLYYATKPEEVLDIVKQHEAKAKFSKIEVVKAGSEAAFKLGSRIEEVTIDTYDANASEYHSVNYKHLPSKEQLDEFKEMVNAPAQVLDVGPGPGLDTAVLAEKYSVTGVEVSKRMAEIAKFENPNAHIICGDIRDVELDDNTFKGIWARDSLHHIPKKDQVDVFKKLSKSLVEDGILYVIVREGKDEEMVEKEQKTYGEVDRFYYLYNSETLLDLAKQAGMSLVKMEHVQRSHKWISAVFKKNA